MIKGAPISFFGFVFIAALVVFMAVEWHYAGTIQEKDSTLIRKDADLAQKDDTIKTISEQRDAANRENDKLRNENAAYAAAHSEKSSPLKNRAIILAKQFSEFGDLVSTNENVYNAQALQKGELYREMWQVRFEPRVSEILKELDVQGQSSDYLPAGVSSYNMPSGEQVKKIASEIDRMAKNLPESSP